MIEGSVLKTNLVEAYCIGGCNFASSRVFRLVFLMNKNHSQTRTAPYGALEYERALADVIIPSKLYFDPVRTDKLFDDWSI